MRYYLYLDKCFLRTLFSILETSNFNIEVVEYSVRKKFSSNSQIGIDPGIERVCDDENSCNNVDEEKKAIGCRNNNINKEKIGFEFEHGNSYCTETERKYINIEDITDMKNINFYHSLLENIRNNNRSDEDRIREEIGFINPLNEKRTFEYISNEKDGFFMLNNNYVWFDKNKLEGDINLLSQMSCKIKVIGYVMNCAEESQKTILKAIAIYIE